MIRGPLLVTGGTGFIGSWLVERLALESVGEIRVLVRAYTSASRIARFPIHMVRGDILSPPQLQHAMNGCELVFHCAYGNSGSDDERRRANIAGTRNVLEAALQTGVKRVVYVSTLDVYGMPRDGVLDETAPLRSFGRLYSDSKREAEEYVRAFVKRHQLQVVILQPTIVYGPFAPVWTADILRTIREGQILLIDEGQGYCNPVFIDDVVHAILLAAEKENASGEAILISGSESVTWREFFGAYEAIAGINAAVSMTAREAADYYRRAVKNLHVRSVFRNIMREHPAIRERLLQTPELHLLVRMAKAVIPGQRWQTMRTQINAASPPRTQRRPPAPLPPDQIRYYQARMTVRIDKARRLLGYEPAFGFTEGMRITQEWARWANLA